MPLTRDSIEQKVASMIVDSLGVDESEVTPDALLVTDLGCDSLDLVQLVILIEEEFGIEIDESEAEKVRTVKDAYDLVERKAA